MHTALFLQEYKEMIVRHITIILSVSFPASDKQKMKEIPLYNNTENRPFYG